MATYTPAQAAKALQMAPSSIRNHCSNPLFRPFLSATATPPAGQARTLGDQDLRVLAFIRQATQGGATLQSVAERLSAGELADYVPEEAPEPEPPGALMLAVQTMATQLEEERKTRQELTAELIENVKTMAGAESRILALEEEIDHLRALLGDKEELERLRAQVGRPGLFRRLFGKG